MLDLTPQNKDSTNTQSKEPTPVRTSFDGHIDVRNEYVFEYYFSLRIYFLIVNQIALRN